MSQWFDLSYNANKLRQSYVKGFLNVSGGGVYVRSDNSLNFYTKSDGVVPKFALDATNYRVYGKERESDISDNYHDISLSQLAFLKDLSDNAQDQLDTLVEHTKYIRSDTSDNNTVFEINGSDSNNKHVVLHGDLVPGQGETYDLGSSDKPFRNLFLKNNTIFFDTAADAFPSSAVSFNTDKGTLDVSFNGSTGVTVLSYDDKVGIGISDVRAPTTALDISGQLKINSGDQGIFVESGDVSLNDNLSVNGTTSLSSTLFVQDKSILNGDVSINSNLTLGGDLSMEGDLVIKGNLSVFQTRETETISTTVTNYELIVTQDISLNGGLYASGDVSINDKLFVAGDASLNESMFVGNTLHVGGDVSMNKKLFVNEDVSINASVYIGADLGLFGGFINQY